MKAGALVDTQSRHGIDPRGPHDLGVEGAAEEPALVRVRRRLEEECLRDARDMTDVHQSSLRRRRLEVTGCVLVATTGTGLRR